jgi:membrane-bound lytic murein transglycosylase D
VLAQEIDTALTLDDLQLEADTTGFNALDVDDMLNPIFSDQMDSMMSSWDIQNRFNFSNSEVRTANYPKNLPDSVYINRLKEIEQVTFHTIRW